MILCQMTTIFISYIEILDTDTRRIEMHRIKYALVESRNKSKLIFVVYFGTRGHGMASN